jgi:hypothetical protein
MYRIRRFGVMKTSTVIAAIYLLVTVIFFVPLAILAAAVGGNTAGTNAVGVLVFGLFAAIVYGLVGWLFTAIACVLYNVAAGWVGGIEVQVEPVAPPTPAPLWGPTTTSTPTSAPPAG